MRNGQFTLPKGFADQIGADGYSPDAPGAVKLIKRLMA
jgi:methanogenic corrinoid protein MtbC1